MRTIYAACLSRLGLSQAEAAALHKVRIDTVKSWSAGRNPVPQGAWDDLRGVADALDEGALELLDRWDAAGQPPIEINDSEAGGRALMAAAEFVLASSGPVRIGQTPATSDARRLRRFSG
jgi:hypothetical protein